MGIVVGGYGPGGANVEWKVFRREKESYWKVRK